MKRGNGTQVELYNPEKHGMWQIRTNEVGNLVACQADSDTSSSVRTLPEITVSPMELTRSRSIQQLLDFRIVPLRRFTLRKDLTDF